MIGRSLRMFGRDKAGQDLPMGEDIGKATDMFPGNGAGGGQGIIGNALQRGEEPAIDLLGRCTVKQNMADGWIGSDQSRDIVWEGILDLLVQAPLPDAGSADIPKRDMMGKQKVFSRSIILFHLQRKQRIDHGPKIVSGIPIVHGTLQGTDAGHAA